MQAYRAIAALSPTPWPSAAAPTAARLSFMGLPCPNLSTGGMNGHGRKECVAVQDMDTMVDVLEKLVTVK